MTRPPLLLTTVLLAGGAVSAPGQASCDPCAVDMVSDGPWERNGELPGVPNWHNEGGKRMTNEIVRFQVRPHPLAE
jgi:hypothetical protein